MRRRFHPFHRCFEPALAVRKCRMTHAVSGSAVAFLSFATALLAGCHYHGDRVLVQNQWSGPIEFQWIDARRTVIWATYVDANSSVMSRRPGAGEGIRERYADLDWAGPAAMIRVKSGDEVLFEREFADFDCVASDGSLIGHYGRWDWDKGYFRFVVTQRDVVYVLDDIKPPMKEPDYKPQSGE